MKVLVVDDDVEVAELITIYVEMVGHEALVAHGGRDAIELFKRHQPDMVIMDCVMPTLSGADAVAHIRAHCGERWVPIIMISALIDEQDVANALNFGADDFLPKPINPILLDAKLNSFRRIAELQQQLAARTEELQRYYDLAEEEMQATNELMKRIVRWDALDNPQMRYWLQAAGGVSGDVIAVARAANGVFYVMLADATGHGLVASVNLIPLTQVFYAMTSKGFHVASIVEEMNRQVRAYSPVDRFVAVTLVAIDANEHILEVWNGGNPPALCVDRQGRELRRFRSQHMPVGILRPAEFSGDCEYFRYDREAVLLLCSDGLLDAANAERARFGLDGLLQALSPTVTVAAAETLRAAVLRHVGAAAPHDDISLAVVDCPLQAQPMPAANHATAFVDAPRHWRLQLTLSAPQLREVDLVPMVMNWAKAMGLQADQAGRFFLVVTELYTNALDHGLLGLDSTVKAADDGLMTYMEERMQRLQYLQRGEIDVLIEQRDVDGREQILIQVRDSGRGFDYAAWLGEDIGTRVQRSGRGIGLIRRLATSIEYRGCGNEVRVLL